MTRGKSAASRRRRQKALERAAKAVREGKPVGDTSRTFHFALRLVVEQQLELFYAPTYNEADFPNAQSVKKKFEEFHEDFAQLLRGLSNYMGRFARDQRARQDNSLMVRHALEALGLDSNQQYTLLEVRSQYRKLANQVHPDHHNGTNPPGDSPVTMTDLNEAFDFLKGVLK